MKLYTDQWIVVTGGAGFIGSCTVRHLNDKGYSNIVVVDELGNTDKWKNLSGKKLANVIDKSRLFEWLEGRESEIEAFIHLGACTNTLETDANYLLENNTFFSQRLAEYALKHGHRFIYSSSAATYGNGSQGFKDDSIDSLKPTNMYGFSKHLFDQWLQSQGVLDKVVGLKYFNVFGPNEYHKGRMASALFHMFPTAQKEGVVRLFKSSDPQYPNGGQMRDFIYVKDAVKMTCAFLENSAGGLFNIGSGVPSTWNQVAQALNKALDKKPNIEYIEMPKDIIGYQNYTCADMTKTKAALGNTTDCQPLEDAVADYVKNYLIPGEYW